MTTADAVASLRAAGVSEDIVNEASAILGECDRARFAAGTFTDENAKSLARRVKELIKGIEKEGR